MKTKIAALFSSIRFWQLLIILIIQILVALNIIDGAQGTNIANLISGFLGAVVLVGTSDKRAEALKGSTTVTIPKEVSSVSATTTKE